MESSGRIWFHGFLAWIEGAERLIAVDTGYDVASGMPFEGSSLDALAESAAATGKPVAHILVTHHHWDHTANLPLLLERWPETSVVGHAANPLAEVTLRITSEERLILGDVQVVALPTPGHSDAGDDVSYWLPEERFLFSGDLAQPQGPSYAASTGPSPVPFFHDGAAYLRSLERLLALDMSAMRTGHGDLLGPEQARQWLRVTYATVGRIAELAIEVVEKYPDRSLDWLCELVYDRVADERHYGFRQANARKRPRSADGGPSDYERFDKPGIRYWVEQAKT